MKPVLVTGASGFVGWHVARRLREHGEAVRCLVRGLGTVPELDVEIVRGDLRDAQSLVQAAKGCSSVFHVAADYRLWARNPTELFASNVAGTRNVIDAARQARVDSVIYTSTVGCIGVPPGQIGDEKQPVSRADMKGAYKQSKFEAEQVALSAAAAGMPVVIVNPTAPVGEHDRKPTPTGKIILDFLRGAMPAFIDTGLNLVDVGDVADGHIAARERGRAGERYILGCENLTLQQILERLGKITGRPAPRTKIPYFVAYAAGLVTTAWAQVTGTPPIAPLDAVRMAKKKMFVTHHKAQSQLDWNPGPVDSALERAVSWFTREGYVTRR